MKVGAVENYFAPFEGLPGTTNSEPGEYLPDRLIDETLSFIRRNRERRFYVQLWHYAVHTPIMAPEDVVAKYRRKREKLGDGSLNPTYAAMIDVVDQGIGRITAELDKLGLSERTLILLSSDNGARTRFGSESLTSVAPLRGEKGHLEEGGVRVPMLVHWPGKKTTQRVSDQDVSVMDFYPTILEVAGVPLPPTQRSDGQSLVPLLLDGDDKALRGRPIYWYNPVAAVVDGGEVLLPSATVLQEGWKLVRAFELPGKLYYLPDDLGESNDLASDFPDRVRTMGRLLDAWLIDTGVALPTRNPRYDPSYVISRQVDNKMVAGAARLVRRWRPAAGNSSWRAARMVVMERKRGTLRLRAAGLYPEIVSSDVSGLGAGLYAVQLDLRVANSGRLRLGWTGSGDGGVIELFPSRNGRWHTLTALINARSELRQLTLAGPTHLHLTGQYEPDRDPDYIEVRAIRLYGMQ